MYFPKSAISTLNANSWVCTASLNNYMVPYVTGDALMQLAILLGLNEVPQLLLSLLLPLEKQHNHGDDNDDESSNRGSGGSGCKRLRGPLIAVVS